MVFVTLFFQWRPELLVGFFTSEAAAREVGADFLRIISWNFIAQGIVFTCSGIFQGLGNTRPALLSSATRILVFAPLAVFLSTQPGFAIRHVWYVSVLTVLLQAALSLTLLHREFRRRLGALPAEPVPAGAGPAGSAEPAEAEAGVVLERPPA
jgi:Na+-driven multidrug efflux pump